MARREDNSTELRNAQMVSHAAKTPSRFNNYTDNFVHEYFDEELKQRGVDKIGGIVGFHTATFHNPQPVHI